MRHNLILRLFLALLLALPLAAQESRALTNQDVIKLVKSGLASDIIVTTINSAPGNYDVSVDGLTALAQARVPNEIIKAMQAKSAVSGKGVGNSQPQPAGGAYPLLPDAGVYLWDGKQLHLLYQNEASSTGGNVLRNMTPFVKKKYEIQLVNARAKACFENQQPVLLISGLGEITPGVPSYRLLYVKPGGMLKDRRIVGTYNIGFFGGTERADNEIECRIKKVREGVYAIEPAGALKDGEYGLTNIAAKAAGYTIWDFGIYAEGCQGQKGK